MAKRKLELKPVQDPAGTDARHYAVRYLRQPWGRWGG
jgi:hypothetical protein